MDNRKVHIELADLKNKRIVTAAFAYGFLDESDSQVGIGHLTEHCLCSAIHSALDCDDVFGYIDDNYIVINILTPDTQFTDTDFKKLLENIDSLIDSKMVTEEKAKLKREIRNRYGSPLPLFSEYIKSRVIKTPRRLARRRDTQLENINTFLVRDVKTTLRTIVQRTYRIFIGDSNQTTSICVPTKPLRSLRRIQFSNIKKRKMPSDLQKSAFAVAFDISGMCTPSQEAFGISFLAEEIFKRFEAMFSKVSTSHTLYQLRIEEGWGILWFALYSETKLQQKVLPKNLFACIKSVTEDDLLYQQLEKFKLSKEREMRKDWKNSVKRFDWIVEGSIENGGTTDLESELSELKGLTIEQVRVLAKQYLKESKMYLFA